MNTFTFKSNPKLMAIKTSNNFGDQIIFIVDISKSATIEQRASHPFIAGKIVTSITNSEGNHIEFNEENLLKL